MAAPKQLRLQILQDLDLDTVRSLFQQLEDHINSGVILGPDGKHYVLDVTTGTWVLKQE